MRQDSPYQTPENIKSVLAVLKERVREEDMVYAGWGAVPAMRFYQGKEGRPANYYYRTSGWCGASSNSCLREIADLAYWLGIVDGRIWFVTPWPPDMSGLSVEHVVSGGSHDVYLIEDSESLIDRYATDVLKNIKAILTRKPSIRSTFDVHLSEDMLIYFKEPCGAEDVQETFFLHVDPADASDLPTHRQRHGFDNLDFRFRDYSFPLNERCVALRELPDYAITSIRTGQYTDEGHVWEGEVRFDE